jgi:hypothetical protein
MKRCYPENHGKNGGHKVQIMCCTHKQLKICIWGELDISIYVTVRMFKSDRTPTGGEGFGAHGHQPFAFKFFENFKFSRFYVSKIIVLKYIGRYLHDECM